MQNLVFEWVDFQNFSKFEKKLGNFGQNLAQNWAVWYMNGSLFFKNWYLYGSTFKFPLACPYQNQRWEPHSPPPMYPMHLQKSVIVQCVTKISDVQM